jgi:hypothetical protein
MRRRRRVLTQCQREHRAMRRFGLTVAAVLLCAMQVQADTQTWNVVASCDPQFTTGFPACGYSATINAVMVTTPETGTFYNAIEDLDFTGTEPVVTSISGTFNGLPMTLVANPTGWWLGSTPEGVAFIAGGIEYVTWWDGSVFIQPVGNSLETEYLDWSAVDPVGISESPMLPMALTGVVGVLWLKRRKMRQMGANRV